MKGIIFTLFNQLVEEKIGFSTWNKMLDNVKPVSEGIYTSADTYPDSELFDLIKELSNQSGEKVEDLLFTFGEYALGELAKMFPEFFSGNENLKSFLQSIHGVIHVEVKKLYPDVVLPIITYEDPGPDKLIMIYESPRKLCRLGEGLIEGAAKYYSVEVTLDHTKCLKQGDDHCRFELDFSR
jgi:predicted hydrocarbon binding protein